MDTKDRSIAKQVAFKGAVDLAVQGDLDLTSPEGQAKFEEMFSYLTESLLVTIGGDVEQAAEVIRGNFPGTTNVSSGDPGPVYNGGGGLSVKGTQHGPLPEWLFEAAASKGITEVYDNRDRAQGTKRPWFRSTTGGDDAVPFWPPR